MFHLVLESHDGRAPGADSEEKHEPVSDIDTVVVDSLKALDPEWPIREADMRGGMPEFRLVPAAEVEALLAPKPLLPPPTQLRDAAAAPDEPTAAAPASPSTEDTMSQQLGARGNDRDQHQLLECLRCNFIAHMLSDVHAEHDWQHRSRRD